MTKQKWRNGDKAMYRKITEKVCERMQSIENKGFKEECKISNIDMDKWEWPQGVGIFGMYTDYKRTGDKNIFNWIINWFENGIRRGIPDRNINTTAPMLTLAYIAEETQNKKYMDLCIDWVNWVIEKLPRTKNGIFQHICTGVENKNQVWDDSLFMTVLFVAKMAQILNDKKLKDEVEYQFLMHVRYLFDTKTGLWFHGWTFEGNHNFAGARWGRGNCWITASIPIVLEILPDMAESVKRYLINVLECQVEALVKYQDKGGLWHTIIDDETSYVETSAGAGFAYGILKAVHMGIIDKKYEVTGKKAIDALLQQISDDGTVNNVSYGTPMGDTIQFYKDIPVCTIAYGQALALLALGEADTGSDNFDS